MDIRLAYSSVRQSWSLIKINRREQITVIVIRIRDSLPLVLRQKTCTKPTQIPRHPSTQPCARASERLTGTQSTRDRAAKSVLQRSLSDHCAIVGHRATTPTACPW